jgi:hypothetical protein
MEIWKKLEKLTIDSVFVNDQTVCFFICDGRTISVSLSLYPEFDGAQHDPIRNCLIVDDAQAVYWPDFDKTISLEEILKD